MNLHLVANEKIGVTSTADEIAEQVTKIRRIVE